MRRLLGLLLDRTEKRLCVGFEVSVLNWQTRPRDVGLVTLLWSPLQGVRHVIAHAWFISPARQKVIRRCGGERLEKYGALRRLEKQGWHRWPMKGFFVELHSFSLGCKYRRQRPTNYRLSPWDGQRSLHSTPFCFSESSYLLKYISLFTYTLYT